MKGDFEFLKNKDLKMEKRIKNYYERMKEWNDNEAKMPEEERKTKMHELRDEHFELYEKSSEYKEIY